MVARGQECTSGPALAAGDGVRSAPRPSSRTRRLGDRRAAPGGSRPAPLQRRGVVLREVGPVSDADAVAWHQQLEDINLLAANGREGTHQLLLRRQPSTRGEPQRGQLASPTCSANSPEPR
jgi:hypothetical protein